MAESHEETGAETGFEYLPFELEENIVHGLETAATFIDLIGVAIVLFGFVVALIKLVGALVRGAGLRMDLGDMHGARIVLGSYILTGVEFMIASDIIHTVITREITDLLFVGLLVVIRTAISFFLQREIKELAEEQNHDRPKGAAHDPA
ncbi:MAG: DUF1622 domain-containing protein [Pseudomonadota bacterium]